MKNEKSRLEGIRKEASNLLLLLYQFLRRDVMAYITPCSLTLEKTLLLLPEAITSIETTLHTASKILEFIKKDGAQALKRSDLFPTINKILPELVLDDTAQVPIEMHLRRARGENQSDNTPITFKSYVMRGGALDTVLEKACSSIKKVLIGLEKSLKGRLESFTNDPLLTAVATLLDTKSYAANGLQCVIENATKIQNGFNEHCLGN